MKNKKDINDRTFTFAHSGLRDTHPEVIELMIAFAEASWTWTHTESCLFRLFAHVVEPKTNLHTKALRAAFFSVISPLGRLDMINAVIAANFDKEFIKHWNKIYLEYRAQIATRGRLAHLCGFSYSPKNGKPRAILMEPRVHPRAKHTHGEANAVEYTASYLNRLTHKWGKLAAKVSIFILLVDETDMLSEYAQQVASLLVMEDDPSSPIPPKPTHQPTASQA
ncbi:hypothetical protein GHT07_05775 [Caenimonas koreensis DSM 17982]|uniref:Uncharacterized protein n=1 Tax=Caenimonas koreensis DSM 17982 TaxID=1121255 RepID=A0A844ART4_9BURK|nr:hypothetical protein [Caenimonas koreensis]MRD46774.1 hypothetical protein [Caenimonas koreensis DSM 17982]